MNERVVARLFSIRRWTAVSLLAICLIAYPIAWSLDPFVWGVAVVLLSPVQVTVAVLGIAARLWRDRKDAVVSWIVDVLLLVMVVANYAFARTISWA